LIERKPRILARLRVAIVLHRTRRMRSRGFTLVELMIVVAIMGVMGSVAMYALAASTSHQGAASLARSLQLAAQRARTEAVSDHRQRRLSCTAGGCSHQIATTSGMGSVTFQPAGSELAVGKHARIWNLTDTTDVAIDNSGSAMAGTRTLTFFPDGSATRATIYVNDSARGTTRYKVYVYAGTGMARLVSNW
jgi:prepilin-type N-terminal cleavage/methylation domain-containing protein